MLYVYYNQIVRQCALYEHCVARLTRQTWRPSCHSPRIDIELIAPAMLPAPCHPPKHPLCSAPDPRRHAVVAPDGQPSRHIHTHVISELDSLCESARKPMPHVDGAFESFA